MRAYFVTGDDTGIGVAIVADTAKEAKRIAFDCDGVFGAEWVYLRTKWLKEVDVSGLKKGEISPMDGLRIGAYAFVYGMICPYCGNDGDINSKVYMGFCEVCKGVKEKDV